MLRFENWLFSSAFKLTLILLLGDAPTIRSWYETSDLVWGVVRFSIWGILVFGVLQIIRRRTLRPYNLLENIVFSVALAVPLGFVGKDREISPDFVPFLFWSAIFVAVDIFGLWLCRKSVTKTTLPRT
jgi:hypothetical protein